MAAQFTYEPLDPKKQEIRLIRLSRDLQDGLIACDISTHDGSNKDGVPPYRALSYTWGVATERVDILINGKLHAISPTLHEFLHSFAGGLSQENAKEDRGKEDRESLWIDQLCINQKNDQEKNHQVSMMAQIYENARSVIVWLHPHYAGVSTINEKLQDWIETSTRLHADADVVPQWEREDHTVIRHRNFLKILSSHPYWSRLWVIQEFLLAKHLTILHGTEVIPADPLKACVRHCHAPPMYVDPFRMLRDASREPRPWQPTKFAWYSGQICADPRDYVYGLSALVETNIEVDYNKPVIEILLSAVAEILRKMSVIGPEPEFYTHRTDHWPCHPCGHQVDTCFRLARAMLPNLGKVLEPWGYDGTTSKAAGWFLRKYAGTIRPAHEDVEARRRALLDAVTEFIITFGG